MNIIMMNLNPEISLSIRNINAHHRVRNVAEKEK